ncbi:chromosome segregation protein ScpA [Candidatus Nitrosocosmicus sp. R]
MVDENVELDQVSTKKRISQPPLNLLFNPSLIERNDVWQINIVKLLETLLSTLTKSSYKDLRVCGVAILTSSLIHRLKVESIFRLEKIANKDQQGISERDKEFSEKTPIPEISNLTLPFRKELSYPVSLEDLISILETMITDLTNPVVKRTSLNLEPVEVIDFQHYLIKFEKIIEEFENRIMKRLEYGRELNFNEMMIGLDRIDVARYFIAMLYLSMKDKIEIITGFTDMNKGIDYLDSSRETTGSIKTTDNILEWIKIALKNNIQE